MKCPVCEGIGEIQEGTGYAKSEGVEEWRLVDCPHCRGTGEIQGWDWWLCEVGFTGKNMVLLYRPDQGLKWVLGVVYVNKPVTPLYRMEKVK